MNLIPFGFPAEALGGRARVTLSRLYGGSLASPSSKAVPTPHEESRIHGVAFELTGDFC